MVFGLRGGKVAYDDDEDDDWDDDEMQSDWKRPEDTDEFKGRVDGWYWQWRRVRFGEVMGRGFRELRGPFVTEALANADRKASPDPFEKMKSS